MLPKKLTFLKARLPVAIMSLHDLFYEIQHIPSVSLCMFRLEQLRALVDIYKAEKKNSLMMILR